MDGVAIDGVQILDDTLLDTVTAAAGRSQRRRMNLNLHDGASDNPHRFFNVLLRDTYIPPHRHLSPPKPETFLILRGTAAFFIFEDNGDVRESITLSSETGTGSSFGIDIRPGLWHTLVVLSERAVCFEVKPGPYDPKADKEFAPWAPMEGSRASDGYLQKLLDGHERGFWRGSNSSC